MLGIDRNRWWVGKKETKQKYNSNNDNISNENKILKTILYRHINVFNNDS